MKFQVGKKCLREKRQSSLKIPAPHYSAHGKAVALIEVQEASITGQKRKKRYS